MAEERHYNDFRMWQTEPRSATTGPGRQEITFIYFSTTAIHRDNDPSRCEISDVPIAYSAPTLLSARYTIIVRRNWIEDYCEHIYSNSMFLTLSSLGVPEDAQPLLFERMRTEFARRWERDLPITVCLAYVTVSFSSDLTSNPTFPNLESTFERGRDITAYMSTRAEDLARIIALAERQSVVYASNATLRERSCEPKFIPATKSAIEGLRKVTLDSSDGAAASFTCAICRQEDLLDDQLEVVEEEKEIENHGNASLTTTQLPCLHIYHETCIVRWLQISHLCPLCRHPMPTAQVGEKSNPA